MKTRKHTLLPLAAFAGLAIATSSASAATTAYRNLILGDNPIVYYEFDETGGTTAANSATTGTTYTGTFNTTGGAITVGQSSFAQGGTAYDFGGGIIGAASALTTSLPEWTVEAWVNYSDGSASNFLSNDQGGWNDDIMFGLGAENNDIPVNSVGLVHQGNPGGVRETVSSPLAAGEWHHIGMTGSESAGEIKLYVDGILVDTNNDLANGATFNGADGFGGAPHLTIGASRPDGLRPYGGLLDEVAIYDSVLTPAQISAHANATIPEPGSALLLALGSSVLVRRRR